MSEPPPNSPHPAAGLAPSPLRSVLAVVLGFFLRRSLASLGLALIASIVPTPNATRGLVMAIVWSGFASLCGGLAAGVIAGRYEVRHGLVLAAVFLGMGAFAAGTGEGPLWWNVANAAVSAVAVIWGAAVAAIARRRRIEKLHAASSTA